MKLRDSLLFSFCSIVVLVDASISEQQVVDAYDPQAGRQDVFVRVRPQLGKPNLIQSCKILIFSELVKQFF